MIDLINNGFSSTEICGMPNSKLVDVDGSGSSVCSPIIDNNYMVQNCVGDDTVLCYGDNDVFSIVGSSDSFKVVSDYSVEMFTKRIFRIGDVHVLFDLKSMAHQFGMKWNFITTRNGRRISCNRAIRHCNRKCQGLRKGSSINCGCDWVIRLKCLDIWILINALYQILSRLRMIVGFILILVTQHFLINMLWLEHIQVNTTNVLTLYYRK